MLTKDLIFGWFNRIIKNIFKEVDAIGKFECDAFLRHMATPDHSQMHQIQSFLLQQPDFIIYFERLWILFLQYSVM
jgi:hypothetical protein